MYDYYVKGIDDTTGKEVLGFGFSKVWEYEHKIRVFYEDAKDSYIPLKYKLYSKKDDAYLFESIANSNSAGLEALCTFCVAYLKGLVKSKEI